MRSQQSTFSLQEREEQLAPSAARSTLRIARDEMNLAEFPLAVLSTRVNTDVKTLEFKDSIRLKNGELMEREWIITGADKFGLPTSTDDDVILGLMCLTMEQGFRDRKVFFSRYELLKILQWSTEGRNYSRLSKSLDRLSGVRIRATNAFFDNSAKGFQTRNFGIIDAYEICDKRGTGEKSYFVWSEVLFESFQSGFIKKLDLDFYFSLRSAVSRRLYRYLDKHFYHRSTVEKPLLALAFEKLGLSRSYQYVSSIKQQIEPAIEELLERGFLANFEYEGRGATTLIRFQQNPSFGQKPQKKAELPEVLPISDDKRELEERLTAHGLTPFQSKRLLQRKSHEQLEKVKETVQSFESLKASGGTNGMANPVGFLYRAVEDSERYVIPQRGAQKPVKSAPKAAPKAPSIDPTERARREQEQNQAADEAFFALPKEEQRKIREQIEEKLSCLKGILDKARFEEAIQGCIRDRMRKR